jgi:hypothetical protein
MMQNSMRAIRSAATLFAISLAMPSGSGNAIQVPSRQDEDVLVPVAQNGKFGYADKEGRIVIRPQFTVAHDFSEGLALVWTEGVPLTDSVVKSFVKMGYIDRNGRWVFHSRWNHYFFDDFSEGLVPFRQQSAGWGYMDRNGKIVIRPRFEWAGSFSNDVAPVLSNDKCAYIDKAGNIKDESQLVLRRKKFDQNRHGVFESKPRIPPCS